MPRRYHAGTAALALLIAVLAVSAMAQSPLLVVRVGDVAVADDQIELTIPVWMTNYQDVVAGFEVWLQLSRSGVIELQEEVDTAGCLTSGWEYLEGRHLTGQPTELKIAGIADLQGPPITPGISPQQEAAPLLRLKADLLPIPDTASERTVDIIIQYHMLTHYNWSDQYGNSIGLIHEEMADTSFYRCQSWAGDICLSWAEVSGPPYDSLNIVTNSEPCLDTERVFNYDGTITVTAEYVCGDINGSGSGPDVSDLVFLVTYMFSGGEAPPSLAACDVNGSGGNPDVSDLVYLVTYMFSGGDSLMCP
jgi:hypothetical protein